AYLLQGEGIARLIWTGNTGPTGGATAALKDRDTIVNNIHITRLTSANLTPISISVPANPIAPSAPFTYSIVDSTGLNQYKLLNPATGLQVTSYTTTSAQGTTQTPIVVFNPAGVGFQRGSMTVTAEGDTRTFILNA